jgi:hypothetical protein
MTLHLPGEQLSILANVTSCTKDGKTFAIVAQPFALAGPAKEAWQRLLQSTRGKTQPLARVG